MRLTVLGQIAKGLAGLEQTFEDEEEPEKFDLVWTEKRLERLKWYLWHGNVYQALQSVEMLEWDLEGWDTGSDKAAQLLKAVRDFGHYIGVNQDAIPNYGDRYRHGETISTSFVESAVNQVVSKRMVKRQQMRWTKRGAHLLLQIRTRVLNEDLRNTFGRWYPGMETEAKVQVPAA
jgi:hypothetical protein